MASQDTHLLICKNNQYPSVNVPKSYWVIVVISVFVLSVYFSFFHHLANRDFWSSHEARAAMNANSILEGTGTMLPRIYDGSEDLQKPPLYYWLVAGISSLRGTNADSVSVRLPSALSATGIIILLLVFLWKNYDFYAGVLGACILITCIHFGWLARIGRIDMTLAFFTTSSILSFYESGKTQGWAKSVFLLITYIAMLIAVLMKGLPAFVLILPLFFFWFLFLIFCDNATNSFPKRLLLFKKLVIDYHLVPGLLCVVLLSGLYFYMVNEESGGRFYDVFFGYHHWVRALGDGALRSHPVWFYVCQFFVDFVPWSPLFYFSALAVFFSSRFKLSSIHWFGLIWFFSMFLVLSLVSYKRADYLLPAYPGAAIFLSVVLSDFIKLSFFSKLLSTRTFYKSLAGILFVSSVSWVWYVDFYLPKYEPMREMKSAAKFIRNSTFDNILFFNMESHALAFHIGKPLETIVGWENLEKSINLKKQAFLLTYPENIEEISGKFPDHKLNVLYSKNSQLTKGFSRPFVFIELKSQNDS